MKRIDDYSIHDDLPESLKRKNAQEIAKTVDEVLHKYESKIQKVLIYPVIDQLDSELVDALAIQLHCDFYDKSLSLEKRRQIVKTSIAWHRIKGTPAAVEMLTQTIFRNSYTKEWFEYGGRPYFFRMVQDISDGREDVTPETLAQLKKAIWMGKNVRSWLEMLEFLFHTEDTITFSEEITDLYGRLVFHDYVPYGHRIWVPERDGSLYRGGVAYRDGSFFRNGELLRNGMTPGDWPIHYGWDALSMDDLFVETLFRFYDDVSWGGLLRDGSISRNGEFSHGGADTFPADLGLFDLEMLYRFSDTVNTPKDKFSGRLDFRFADIVPYGHRYITQRDGEAYRGGIAYRDGTYNRDGLLFRNGCNPGEAWEHFGAADLSMDELFTAACLSFFDDFTAGGLCRDGRIRHDGRYHHGADDLPADFGIFFADRLKISETLTPPKDKFFGRSTVRLADIVPYGHRYIPIRDGSVYRGGVAYRDESFSRDGEICRNGQNQGETWERGGASDLSMDELFTAARLSFFDDVSESDIRRMGEVMRDGRYRHGGDVFPVDFGLSDFSMRKRIEDAVPKTTDGKIEPKLSFAFSDIIPYGTNPIPNHSGEMERGGVGNREGNFERDGAFIRDGPSLDVQGERGGKSDLEHDCLTAAIHTTIKDDVSAEIISRNGAEIRNGEIMRGENSLPRDNGIHALTVNKYFADNAEPTDAGGSLSFLYQICRRGDFRRDGTVERGGYSYDDNLSGRLSLLSIQRSGVYCRDGSIETAADGRLIAI